MSNEEYEQDDQNQGDGEGGDGAGEESYDSGDVDSSFVVAENKKPISKSTVVMIVIILCAKAGMYFMYKRSAPSAAQAGDAKAAQVIKQFMSDKEKNFSLMQKMLTETKSVVDQFMNYPNLKQIPLSELQTNPFAVAKPNDDGNMSDARRKQLESEAEKVRDAEKHAIAKAANGLRLMSVVTSGSRKACMINNTLYMQGQIVQADDLSFMIEDIAPNRVVVKCGNFKFELSMQK
jgi:hypothetical protein